MTADYKKRAKAGWNAGKFYKKESNRSERNRDSVEINKQTQEVTSCPSKKIKYSGVHNDINKVIKSFRHTVKMLERYKSYTTEYFVNMRHTYNNQLKQLTPKLESYMLREDADKKLVKQIKELLNV